MTSSAFSRLAIVNRGEPAMRLLHAARELNAEQDANLRTIAFYTEPDARNSWVREADEAFLLGPATFIDPRDNQSKSAYLDYDRLEQALVQCGAEAAWVGWGFVAEHPEFADLCARLGIVFVGPPGSVMRRLGDKIAAKRLAEEAQVPVSPWSNGPVQDLDDARAHAERLGFPLVIKATAGGGGRGIRRVQSASELEEALVRARAEALKAFGNGTVFLEKMVTVARHVEVQVICDRYGAIWPLGIRDCTLQRRNQKVIEEAPSPAISRSTESRLLAAAERLARTASYENAGTVEFLFEPNTDVFYFMEMNTRLQVEHPVTEMTTGVDLVKLQLQVAAGARLEGPPPATVGHAIEVRLNAEDPDNDFSPAPGRVRVFQLPSGPGVRVDTGVRHGDVVSPDFDSMIAKIIACGRTRHEAMARLQRALAETTVVIEDGANNKPFLLGLIAHPDVRNSDIDVQWLDRSAEALRRAPRPFAEVALLYCAVRVYQNELLSERAEFIRTTTRGRPKVRKEVGLPVELRYQGQAYELVVRCLGPHTFEVRVDGAVIRATVESTGPFQDRLTCGSESHRIVSLEQSGGFAVEIDGIKLAVSRDAGGVVRALSPALVVSVQVAQGAEVTAGDRLVVLEAMKTEMVISAPVSGRIREVMALPNSHVEAGSPLVIIEEKSTATAGPTSDRVSFSRLYRSEEAGGAPHDTCVAALETLRRFALGFDVDPGAAAAATRQYQSSRTQVPAEREHVLALEREVLGTFADIVRLHSPEPIGEQQPSPRECLRRHVGDLAAEGEGLPSEFLERLSATLARFGVRSLAQSPDLEEALLRTQRSYERAASMTAAVIAVLEQLLADVATLGIRAAGGDRGLIDSLIDATRSRFSAVHDLALQARFRYLDLPFYRKAQTRAYLLFEQELDAFTTLPDAAHRNRVIELLAGSPLPVLGLLAGFLETSFAALSLPALEILMRRAYREYDLHDLATSRRDSLATLTAQFSFKGSRRTAVSVIVRDTAIEEAAREVSVLARNADSEDVVADVFVLLSKGKHDPAPLARDLLDLTNRADFDSRLGRICFTLMDPARWEPADLMTFARRSGGFEDVAQYRGLHPMEAGSLGTWRTRSFETERLASPEDIYLVRAVAKENPKDERLFVFVMVRDITATSSEEGEEVRLPHLERMLLEAVSCVRTYQSRLPPKKRLLWNRIVVRVPPPLHLDMAALTSVLERLAPSVRNIGLEKIVFRATVANVDGVPQEKVAHFWFGANRVSRQRITDPSEEPIKPLTPYTQKAVLLRARGQSYPYEIIRMLTPEIAGTFPRGEFIEYDLDDGSRLLPVRRPFGQNQANVVVGLIKSFTTKYPEGLSRIIILGDPSMEMGALAEPECRRIIGALDLAWDMGIPVDWFPVSAGAKIAMDSGTENLDWTAQVLRRIIELTQRGLEINVVIDGINVGAQSYWNAEATMLAHTRGILVMTPAAAMVLTGKRALELSGSVSAEDHQGIGGAAQIMAPNGEAQYVADDLSEACLLLMKHHDYAYAAPGERFPRRIPTSDPRDRDITCFPYSGIGSDQFRTVGDIFSSAVNPQRKKPFSIRSVLRAVVDQDCSTLERWSWMRDAEMAVTWDAYLGGTSVLLVGIESRPLPRAGLIPGDGPDTWTGGTLFPLSSKKVARAINSASGRRPVVVLANLSGFDGSPESMRNGQLEYGAEIGRAVVNFAGPMVFCVISRFHGGAYVVFSRALNDNLQVAALEGSFASVIGGAPAAAVVFSREVEAAVFADPAIKRLRAQVDAAEGKQRTLLQSQLAARIQEARAVHQGETAARFDGIHSVQRAKDVGSLHDILPASRLRDYLIGALERGVQACASSQKDSSKITLEPQGRLTWTAPVQSQVSGD